MYYVQRRTDYKVVYIGRTMRMIARFMSRLSPEKYGFYKVSKG